MHLMGEIIADTWRGNEMCDVVKELPKTLLEQAVAVVAYAEVRAVLLTWAGASWDPIVRARAAVRDVLAFGGDGGSAELVTRAQAAMRVDSRAMLEPIIARRGTWPFRRTLAPGQVGSSDGIEEIFHHAAIAAWRVRRDDPRTLLSAIGIADLIWDHISARRMDAVEH